MSPRSVFIEARGAILESLGSELSGPFVQAFPVDGASISVLAGPATGLTVSASDAVATRLDELQFDLGEGPCWSALAHRLPVLMDAHADDTDWPTLRRAIASDAIADRVGAVYAFPLAIGTLDIGAIDLYSDDPSPLTPELLSEASSLADTIVQDHSQGYDAESIGYSRREVHQAAGRLTRRRGAAAARARVRGQSHGA